MEERPVETLLQPSEPEAAGQICRFLVLPDLPRPVDAPSPVVDPRRRRLQFGTVRQQEGDARAARPCPRWIASPAPARIARVGRPSSSPPAQLLLAPPDRASPGPAAPKAARSPISARWAAAPPRPSRVRLSPAARRLPPASSANGPRPRSSESVQSVRIRSTTLARLLHGFVPLQSGISDKMIIFLDTITIIAMLFVSFLPLSRYLSLL